MSRALQEKKNLEQLSDYFKKIETMATKNNIDLDVFISEYNDDGYAVYATEQVAMKDEKEVSAAQKRKKVFEKETKQKTAKEKK